MKKQWIIFVLKDDSDAVDLLTVDTGNSYGPETIWLRLYNAKGAQIYYNTEDEALAAISNLPNNRAYIVLPIWILRPAITITVPPCGLNHTGISITDTTSNNFVIEWTEAAENFDTIVQYRVLGDTTWLTPNKPGNATGELRFQKFVFTGGFTDGIHYEVRVQNICLNGQVSGGVVVDAVATLPT